MHDRKRPFTLPTRIWAIVVMILGLSISVSCTAVPDSSLPAEPVTTPTASPLFTTPETEPIPTPEKEEQVGETAVTPQISAPINIDISAEAMPIDSRVLGTNLPAWLGVERTENAAFLARTAASSVTVIRIPGGSWSNGYDWLACETGTDIDGNETCWSWPWGLRPTDFINFIKSVNAEAIYTINQNGTAKEAAALVAFFNGSVHDDTVIGADVYGRNWGQVSDWAQLRNDNGNPDPLNIQYWEIGNEIYGGKGGMGTDCSPYGWEDVWTCDGREYVHGIDDTSIRREGFLEFYNEMKEVDPGILVGAVGVAPTGDWSNWGNEVIEEAGQVMDFYIIHQYAFFDPPASLEELLAQPQTAWEPIMADITASFDRYANGRRIPITITEHNLFSFQDQDNEQLMTRAVNMLFMADTIGQMLQNGFTLANQWDLANGLAANGTDYGLINADTYTRNPQYYVFPLWAKFGTHMLPVNSIYDAGTTLSVYAGLVNESTMSILAINKTDAPIMTEIQIDGTPTVLVNGTVDVVQASSLDSQTVTFNGLNEPPDDLSEAVPTILTKINNPLSYAFPPYSVTLLQVEFDH